MSRKYIVLVAGAALVALGFAAWPAYKEAREIADAERTAITIEGDIVLVPLDGSLPISGQIGDEIETKGPALVLYRGPFDYADLGVKTDNSRYSGNTGNSYTTFVVKSRGDGRFVRADGSVTTFVVE